MLRELSLPQEALRCWVSSMAIGMFFQPPPQGNAVSIVEFDSRGTIVAASVFGATSPRLAGLQQLLTGQFDLPSEADILSAELVHSSSGCGVEPRRPTPHPIFWSLLRNERKFQQIHLCGFLRLPPPPRYNLTVVRAIEGEGPASPSTLDNGHAGEVYDHNGGVSEAKLEEGKNGKVQVSTCFFGHD